MEPFELLLGPPLDRWSSVVLLRPELPPRKRRNGPPRFPRLFAQRLLEPPWREDRAPSWAGHLGGVDRKIGSPDYPKML